MKKAKLLFVPLVGKTSACRQKEGLKLIKHLPLLPRLTAVLPPQGREMRSGFTLIELLVVVLIIGILAAVALPQYQVAVMRARFAKLYNIARTYERAALEYIAANGTWPSSFADLIIDAPGGMEVKTPSASTCVQNAEFYCCLKTAKKDYQSSGIACGLTAYTLAYSYAYVDEKWGLTNEKACIAKETSTVANKICESYNSNKRATNLASPEGYKSGYYYYKMAN